MFVRIYVKLNLDVSKIILEVYRVKIARVLELTARFV